MSKVWSSLILILLIISCDYSQSYWQGFAHISDGIRQPLIFHTSKEEADPVIERWRKISEELKTTNNTIAGIYIRDGNRGSYLKWSPKNGFVYISHYEHIDVTDFSYGRVEINGSQINFITEGKIQKKESRINYVVPKFWLVIGKYLIPKNQVKDLGNYLAGLEEFNQFNCDCDAFFSKSSSIENTRFVIPQEYKNLFRKPITGEISYASKPKIYKANEKRGAEIITHVKINVGGNQGVRRGYILRIPDYRREIVITKVKAQSSEGIITDFILDEEKGLVATYYDTKSEADEPLPPVRKGNKVTTKLFDQ